jgi:uncharacterized protein YciI
MPAMPDVRARLEPAHLDYLRAHVGEIVLAGGLREAPGAGYVGGLWILEVASKERAVQLVQSDPFYQAEAALQAAGLGRGIARLAGGAVKARCAFVLDAHR